MPCYSPIKGYYGSGGGVVFSKALSKSKIPIEIPCNGCIGCKIKRSRDWAIRCVHEAKMHHENTFITLTYNDDHLPKNNSLDHVDFQKFIRALRQKTKKQIRYYMCGEYGDKFARPHYHALLFGYKFPDEKLWTIRKTRNSSNQVFRSKILEKLWSRNGKSLGFSETGTVTFQSAAYVARYIIKKQSQEIARERLAIVDQDTGELIQRTPEYTKMSLKPGIGTSYYETYRDDIFPLDKIILNTSGKVKEYSVPKYYREKLKLENPELAEKLRQKRYLQSTGKEATNIRQANKPVPKNAKTQEKKKETSPERLAVKQTIQEQNLKLLKRDLK